MTIWKKCFHVSPKHLIAHLSSKSILYVTSNLDAVDFYHLCQFLPSLISFHMSMLDLVGFKQPLQLHQL